MRIKTAAIAASALLILSACQVRQDEQNDTTTVAFNEDVAENTFDDVANTAENVAGDAANEAQEIGQTLENKADNVDVDVDVDRNAQ